MEPTGNGIGGDLFAIVWDPRTSELYGLNASGRSPQGLSLEALKAELDSLAQADVVERGRRDPAVGTSARLGAGRR